MNLAWKVPANIQSKQERLARNKNFLRAFLVSYALISLFQDISRMNMFTRFTLLQLHPDRQPMANLGSGKLQM